MQKIQWAQALLQTLGAPQTKHNVAFLCAWSDMEGTKAAWNPLATTNRMPGATNFNSVGVKNYASFQSGLDATAHGIRNGHYPHILQGLMTNDQQFALSHAQDWLTWAGNSNYSDKVAARMDQYLQDPARMIAEL